MHLTQQKKYIDTDSDTGFRNVIAMCRSFANCSAFFSESIMIQGLTFLNGLLK